MRGFMCAPHRRSVLLFATVVIATAATTPSRGQPKSDPPEDAPEAGADRIRWFIAQSERMRAESIASGDQPYGAVIVRDDRIIGWGRSRVVLDRNPRAHAERGAIMDAQLRLAAVDLGRAVMYSTSQLCPMCEDAAALAGISALYWGPDAINAGKPVRR